MIITIAIVTVVSVPSPIMAITAIAIMAAVATLTGTPATLRPSIIIAASQRHGAKQRGHGGHGKEGTAIFHDLSPIDAGTNRA